MELHIGEEIEKKYQKSGLKLSEFAKRLDTSTRNIYSIFQRPDINSAQLKKISEVLGFDFFSLYQESLHSDIVSEPQEKYTKAQKKSLLVSIELDGTLATLETSINTLRRVNEAL